ncbi:MAG: Nramp family divalent metal transporter [Planctomycetales bacterium]|nr:Nramp family divalent metal transporter [Planctomycetales bacterium]
MNSRNSETQASSGEPANRPFSRGLAGWLQMLGPGMLVAATGVGAGDLATGALTGSLLGVAVLWAVLLGALMKYVLNEGLARWQLATGESLLEGVERHFGRGLLALFLVYMVAWTFWVGAALMGACGVAAHALIPWGEPASDKIYYGIAHSLVAVALVLLGGYRLFERLMSVCIGVMFVTVVVTAAMVRPDWSEVLRGLLWPTIPSAGGQGVGWTVALMGGVGGTLTMLCYGYWIVEEGRTKPSDLGACRIDLASGYTMTALFGVGMVILGSRIESSGKGAALVVQLGNQLNDQLGPVARWCFLIGAWGAVASSLLGVWQSIPYLFADVWRLLRGDTKSRRINTRGAPYIGYLAFIATVPAAGLWMSFAKAQKVYAIVGAGLIPMLALALLLLNRGRYVGEASKNSLWSTIALFATFVFFLVFGVLEIRAQLF